MSGSEDEFSTPSGATVEHVRHELGDAESQVIPTDTITYHLGRAEGDVTAKARDRASPDHVEAAVAADAAFRVVKSNKEAFAERFDIFDVTEAYDVASWIEVLKDDRDDAVGLVTGENQPMLRTLGGRSRRGHSRASRIRDGRL